MLNERDPRGTVIPLEPRKHNTTESSGSQELNPSKGFFGRAVDRYHTFTRYLKQSQAGQDILFPLHELYESLKNPGRILKNAGRYAPNIGFVAAELFALGGAAVAVASAAEIQSESQPDLKLKEIKGVDKDGKPVEFIQFYDGRGTGADKDSKPAIVHQLFPQGWQNDEAGLKAAKQAVLEGYLTKPLIKELFGGKYVFLYRKQSTLSDLKCDDIGMCPSGNSFDPFNQEVDRSISALAPIMPVPVRTTVFKKSLLGVPGGWTEPTFDRRDKVASQYVFSDVVYPEKDTPNKHDKRVFAHEEVGALGLNPNLKDPALQQISLTGTGSGDTILPDDEAFLRQLAAMNNGNFAARFQGDGLKVGDIKPGYTIDKVTGKKGVSIPLTLPPTATQLRYGVYPSSSPTTGMPDGPAIEMIVGDPRVMADIKNNGRLFIDAPKMGEGPYTLLPGEYNFKICDSEELKSVSWLPLAQWEPLIQIWPGGLSIQKRCVDGKFDTRDANFSAATLQAVNLAKGEIYNGKTARLQWADANNTIFLYDVQVAGNQRFDTNPATADTFVWENTIHGGVARPNDTWKTPPLTPDTAYFWRVRPRVQGQNVPTAWGPTWTFKTASNLVDVTTLSSTDDDNTNILSWKPDAIYPDGAIGPSAEDMAQFGR